MRALLLLSLLASTPPASAPGIDPQLGILLARGDTDALWNVVHDPSHPTAQRVAAALDLEALGAMPCTFGPFCAFTLEGANAEDLRLWLGLIRGLEGEVPSARRDLLESDRGLLRCALADEEHGDAAGLVAAHERFGLDLLRRLARKGGSRNLLVSPLSAAEALELAAIGARGETERQLARALRWNPAAPLGPAEAARFCQVRASYAVVSAAFVRQQSPILGAYRDAIDDLGAFARNVDFDAPGAADTIDGWVREASGGLLSGVVAPGDLGPTSNMVLVSAVELHPDWRTRFDPRRTAPRPFRTGADRTIRTPTMSNGQIGARYAHAAGVAVLELPYRHEGLAMDLLLPDDRAGLRRLEETLDARAFDRFVAALRPVTADVDLPRFSFDTRNELDDALRALGAADAFSPSRADFQAIDGRRDLYVSKAFQLARIELDERGTRASAATAVFVRTMGRIVIPPRRVRFVADHPFVFVLRDTGSKELLFVGHVVDPSAGGPPKSAGAHRVRKSAPVPAPVPGP